MRIIASSGKRIGEANGQRCPIHVERPLGDTRFLVQQGKWAPARLVVSLRGSVGLGNVESLHDLERKGRVMGRVRLALAARDESKVKGSTHRNGVSLAMICTLF